MVDPTFKLTRKQYEWFGDRMTESHTGRVSAPSHCYNKFRKVCGSDHLSNEEIKCYLIDNVYNHNGLGYE
jgi:hypothetical protein